MYVCKYVYACKLHKCTLIITRKCVCHLLNSPRSCVMAKGLGILKVLVLIERIRI